MMGLQGISDKADAPRPRWREMDLSFLLEDVDEPIIHHFKVLAALDLGAQYLTGNKLPSEPRIYPAIAMNSSRVCSNYHEGMFALDIYTPNDGAYRFQETVEVEMLFQYNTRKTNGGKPVVKEVNS